MNKHEIAEYQKSACDVRSIESMLATHLGIWLALNTFWATLVWFVNEFDWESEWGTEQIWLKYVIFFVIGIFAFVMNLATNISVATLTDSLKKYKYIRRKLREKLKANLPKELQRIDELKERQEIDELKRERYERMFIPVVRVGVLLKPQPTPFKKIYSYIGLIILIIWPVLAVFAIINLFLLKVCWISSLNLFFAFFYYLLSSSLQRKHTELTSTIDLLEKTKSKVEASLKLDMSVLHSVLIKAITRLKQNRPDLFLLSEKEQKIMFASLFLKRLLS